MKTDTDCDLVIIGAGPAGMAAAEEAAHRGLSVMVLGEQHLPGGQVYRSIEGIGPDVMNILGPDYQGGKNLVQRFRGASVEYMPGATVWQVEVEPDLIVSFVARGSARQVRGKQIVIATGARERPVPIPGWILPGVMAATAADVLLKSHGIVPAGDTVLAGSGPLLFLTATRLIEAGVAVKAVLDTTPFANYAASLPYLPKALLAAEYLVRGLSMKRMIRRSGTPIFRNVKQLEAQGSDAVECVRFTSNGASRKIKVDTLLLHNGVVPDTQITSLLECEHSWYGVQRYWRPVVDMWGNTRISGVRVAGDAAGISGAKAAEASGRLAALEAAFALNIISGDERGLKAAPFRKRLARERLVRPFLDRLFHPDTDLLVPRDDDTVICRCEEVTAGEIRKALELGTLGPNQLKSQTRSGMGPCQGRMCGLSVAEIIADHRQVDVSQVGCLRVRPPIKPITVGQLSDVQLVGQV
jgi:NADPH-dependent 2,4-dienoyl-CoA reductase/sulfur reductase-like enzyme